MRSIHSAPRSCLHVEYQTKASIWFSSLQSILQKIAKYGAWNTCTKTEWIVDCIKYITCWWKQEISRVRYYHKEIGSAIWKRREKIIFQLICIKGYIKKAWSFMFSKRCCLSTGICNICFLDKFCNTLCMHLSSVYILLIIWSTVSLMPVMTCTSHTLPYNI